MGFITQKGQGLFTVIVAIIIASLNLWNFDNITETQKYFGVLALIILLMFFFLLTVIDYLHEETKKEIANHFEKQSSRKKS